jgi:hypothetical protein
VDVGDHGIAHVQLLEVHAEGVLLGDVVMRAPCWYCWVMAVIMLGWPWMAVRCR